MANVLMICDPTTVREITLAPETNFYSGSGCASGCQNYEYRALVEGMFRNNFFHDRLKLKHAEEKTDFLFFFRPQNESILGAALVIDVTGKWCVEYVMAHPEHQYRGIGTALMHHIVWEAKQRNVWRLLLQCKSELVAFYEKFGFRVQ
jgi:GNAT superfamily N-acetyltransferase